MKNSILFKLIFLNIKRNLVKYSFLSILFSFLIFILSSFIFITSSIKLEVKSILQNTPSLTIKRLKGGKIVDIESSIIDDLISINGISKVNCDIIGRYFYEPQEEYFTIIGVDLDDEIVRQNIKNIIKDIDYDTFISKPYMIIGDGVKNLLDYYEYKGYYNFRPSDRSIHKVYIYKVLPKSLNLLGADSIIMSQLEAKKILEIDDEYCSSISIDIPNKDELALITDKIKAKYWGIELISKDDKLKYYESFFNFKSTIFIILYFLSFIAFLLILYQRYSLIINSEKKEIAIFRVLGYSITDIIKLKIFENLIVFILAFVLAINLSYLYVFVFDAPFLKSIFLGYLNLSYDIDLIPAVEPLTLVTLFLFFILPLVATILYPTWKIAVDEPIKGIR